MARAAHPREQFEFVLPEDFGLPEDKRTIWLLRPVSRREQREADNLVTVDPNTGDCAPRIGDMREGCLMVGLKGCKNFLDEDDKEIEFKQSEAKETWLGSRVRPPHPDFLDRLSRPQEIALSDAILNNSRVDAEAGKD